ncbi:hypothetical protein [Levilactobacillus yonginensis]|uniref:hypothetical protein n=1 Tax=Levilactobacillus yonginensis TaxID=1054041 RepID=UPI00345CE9AA
MKKLMLLGLAVFGLASASSVPAQAASQSTKLPVSYQGVWYGYVGRTKQHGKTYYEVDKMTITNIRLTVADMFSSNQNLTHQKWQYSLVLPLAITKKVNQKGHERYVLRANAVKFAGSALPTLRQKQVKVNGKKTTALWLRAEGDNTYAFRRPLRTHSWGPDNYFN